MWRGDAGDPIHAERPSPHCLSSGRPRPAGSGSAPGSVQPHRASVGGTVVRTLPPSARLLLPAHRAGRPGNGTLRSMEGASHARRTDRRRAGRLDAVESEEAALFALSQGGALATLFAAAHQGRTSALVLFGAYARIQWSEEYPWGRTAEEYETLLRIADDGWGAGGFLPLVAPTASSDEAFKRWFARLERLFSRPSSNKPLLVDPRGLEPLTFWLPARRSTS